LWLEDDGGKPCLLQQMLQTKSRKPEKIVQGFVMRPGAWACQDQRATGTQHAGDLVQRPLGISYVFQHLSAQGGVEARVWKGQIEGIAFNVRARKIAPAINSNVFGDLWTKELPIGLHSATHINNAPLQDSQVLPQIWDEVSVDKMARMTPRFLVRHLVARRHINSGT